MAVEFIVFKGSKSQTGIAFEKEFPKVKYMQTRYEFPDIVEKVNEPLQVVLPIWNSHEGEIEDSCALDMIFDKDVRLFYLWPKEIEFECLIKESSDNKVISVTVAESQCSKFIKDNKFKFKGKGSTTVAYEKFKSDCKGEYRAVLCAPGTNDNNYEVLSENAENKLNFTTFSILGSSDSVQWKEADWNKLSGKIFPPNRYFVGIEMPFDVNFSDGQQELFDTLIQDAHTVADIPKAVFVSNYNSSECRILFEACDQFAPEYILRESGVDDSIRIIPNAGMTALNYSDRAMQFLNNQKDFNNSDFIMHVGDKSCFFACPALGILTHGFNVDDTQMIVMKMIDKCFELLARIDFKDNHSPDEELFKKYETQYYNDGLKFVSFHSLN